MTQIYGSFDFVGSYRKWSKGRKGYTKTEHKYKDPTQGSSNYVSMTLGLSPTRSSYFKIVGYLFFYVNQQFIEERIWRYYTLPSYGIAPICG
ncbi:hypothetical protein B9Z55_018430 [Caenorhabditis nigoni]|uniref:Uncharacterized protein n=1 Tax=Caenorhabditis nigoni TaxID=1611254 RepID=A0A2G5TE44_9PELO|nr:hypothetical protein B9Z55_018430 [Caenorhabditis nigoni]